MKKKQIVVRIKEAHMITKTEIGQRILSEDFAKKNPEPITDHRSMFGMKMEWAVHKALFKLGILQDHTGTVDLDWPQPLVFRIAYTVLGLLFWPFIR